MEHSTEPHQEGQQKRSDIVDQRLRDFASYIEQVGGLEESPETEEPPES